MKAAVFRAPASRLTIEEVPTPSAEAGQLLLAVKRCGVCGTDLHLTEEAGRVAPGVVLGHEFCGEVVEVGPEAPEGWREGDRVVSLPFVGCGRCAHCQGGDPIRCRSMRSLAHGQLPGGFGEYVAVGAATSVKLPASLSWDEAALVEPLAVGLHGLRRAKLGPGANVLVVGAGPVGLAVVLWARALGARRVVVTARSDRGAEMALALGATDFIPGDQDVRRQFRKLAGGPPDAVFECVGAPNVLQQCIAYAPMGGQVVVLGGCMKPDLVTPADAMNKELTVTFSLAYDLHDFEVAVDHVARGTLDATKMITDKVGYAAFPDAFEALRNRTHQCKVLLVHGS